MKKVIAASLLFFGLAFTAKAQETTTPNIDPNAPELKFEQEIIDYGVIDYDANTVREFKFKNTGKAPLLLTNVQVSYGCTNVDGWSKDPVAPGKTSTFKVKYDSKRVGKFDKKITVTSNSRTPSTILTIKGEVKPAPVAPATSTVTPK